MDAADARRQREPEVTHRLHAVIAMGAITALAACNTEDGPRSPEDVVIARVEGLKIARGDWERYLRYAIHLPDEPTADGPTTREFPEDVRSRLLDRFLVERVLIARASAQGIMVSDEQLESFAQESGLGDLTTFYEGMPLVQRQYLKSYLRDSLMVKLLVEEETTSQARVSVDEARQHYEENLATYTRPTSYRLRTIRVDTPTEAEKLRQEIAGDAETFQAVANRLTEDENEQGRDLGLWPIGKLPDAFQEPIRKLATGQVSEVIEDPDGGFNIVLVNERVNGGVIPLAQVVDSIRGTLERNRRYELAKDLMAQTQAALKIEIVHENLGFDYTAPHVAAPLTSPSVPATEGGA